MIIIMRLPHDLTSRPQLATGKKKLMAKRATYSCSLTSFHKTVIMLMVVNEIWEELCSEWKVWNADKPTSSANFFYNPTRTHVSMCCIMT
jgi:hypothetical protein